MNTPTTFMRWFIGLTLFAAVIWQSNRIDNLKKQLVHQDQLVISQQVELIETNQQYAALAKVCLK